MIICIFLSIAFEIYFYISLDIFYILFRRDSLCFVLIRFLFSLSFVFHPY